MRSWIRSIQRVERVVEGPGLHRIEVWQYCNAEERTERTMTLQSFLAPLCNLSWLKENKANLKLLSLYYNIMYNIYIYDNTCLYNKYIYILYHCTLLLTPCLCNPSGQGCNGWLTWRRSLRQLWAFGQTFFILYHALCDESASNTCLCGTFGVFGQHT